MDTPTPSWLLPPDTTPPKEKVLSAPAALLYAKVKEAPLSISATSRAGLATPIADMVRETTGTTATFNSRNRQHLKAVAIAALEIAIVYPEFRLSRRANSDRMEFATVNRQKIIDTRKLFHPPESLYDPESFSPLTAETGVLTTFIKGLPETCLQGGDTLLAHIAGFIGNSEHTLVQNALLDPSFMEWRLLFTGELEHPTPSVPPKAPHQVRPRRTEAPPPTSVIATDDEGPLTSRDVIARRVNVDMVKAGDLLTREGRVAFFALLGADCDQPMLIRANAVKEIGRIRGDYEPAKGQPKAPIQVVIAGRQQEISLSDGGTQVNLTDSNDDLIDVPRVELVQ